MVKILSFDKANTIKTRLPDGGLRITIPIKVRQRGGRKEICLPPQVAESMGRKSSENEALVLALTRAFTWMDMLESGRFRSIPELAKYVKMDRSYVYKILALRNLAPDIVDAILDGTEPDGLTLKKLRQGIPMDWEEQRKLFGFPPQN